MAGPVPVHERADFFRPGGEVSHEGLHLRISIRLGRRDDPDACGETIEHAAEVFPVMVHPVTVTSVRIGDIDETAADILLPVLLCELVDLTLLTLPLILRVQDQALERPSAFLLEAPRQELSQGDLSPEPTDVLESADAQTCVHDDVPLLADVGVGLREKLIVPMGQCVSPAARNGVKG